MSKTVRWKLWDASSCCSVEADCLVVPFEHDDELDIGLGKNVDTYELGSVQARLWEGLNKLENR
jgi:hypothetical protein